MIASLHSMTQPKVQVAMILILAFLCVLADATILLGLIVFGLIVLPAKYDPAIRWKLEQEKKDT